MRTTATTLPLLAVAWVAIFACSSDPAPASAPAAAVDEAEPAPAPATEPPAAVGEAQPEPAASAEAAAVGTPEAEPAAEPEAEAPAVEAPAEGDAPPAASAGPASFRIASGEARFLIDAPLEKIKGRWNQVGGSLEIDPSDLTRTRGHVTVGVRSLVTHTFGSPGSGKDARQNEHALNWMEVGTEVDAATRKKYGTARFTIEKVNGANPKKLSAGKMKVSATVVGKLMLHGKSSRHSVDVQVTFEGPPEAPTSLRIETVEPFGVSLVHHDIKPRDLAGRFLSGALEKVGQKIVDQANVSLELKASRK